MLKEPQPAPRGARRGALTVTTRVWKGLSGLGGSWEGGLEYWFFFFFFNEEMGRGTNRQFLSFSYRSFNHSIFQNRLLTTKPESQSRTRLVALMALEV